MSLDVTAWAHKSVEWYPLYMHPLVDQVFAVVLTCYLQLCVCMRESERKGSASFVLYVVVTRLYLCACMHAGACTGIDTHEHSCPCIKY